MNLEEKLQQGIAAAQAGQKIEARTLLREVVEADETQVDGWVWLSQLVDSLEEREICLENILTLEPDNEFALETLPQVKAAQARLFAPAYFPGEEEPPPNIITMPEAAKQPIIDQYPYKDEFDNPWLCPYCVAPTKPEDRYCPSCRQALIIRTRVKEERTTWLWRGIFLQVGVIMALVALGSAAYILLFRYEGIRAPVAFLPLYWGQAVDQPENLSRLVLTTFPPWLFWSTIGAILYSLMLIIVLYLRIPHGNTLYLITSILTSVLSFFSIIFFYASPSILVISILSFLIGLGQLLITLNLWSDFDFKEQRIQLKIDRDAKGHLTLYLSARKYSQSKMWGLATLHMRRAVASNPEDTGYYIFLAVAYANIKRYDLARQALEQVEKLDPTALEIKHLRKLLKMRAATETA